MADMHMLVDEPTEDEIEKMSELMLAFIFPNEPRTSLERSAFSKAVTYQLAHEKTVAARYGDIGVLDALPKGVSSFSIGTFSMSFNGGYQKSATLTNDTICPYAYGVLLRAGLLYKGVPGRSDYEPH